VSSHTLKIQTRWLERVVDGTKLAEIRKHDRDYQAGDRIEFIEVDGTGRDAGEYVEGQWVAADRHEAYILHVLDGRLADGIADDYCLLSIEYVGPVTA